ncbi:MAG: aminopeptidase P N-terminal domain-containing protein [Armatimonadetes bacterium]|nr:aminopeptidase P N-terminal domain-containing protein [Armatimonadota bacterium]
MTQVAVCALTLLVTSSTVPQSPAYPVFENDKIPSSEHAARRQALRDHMGRKSIGVFFTNAVHHRNGDVNFQFRAESNFLYLTGFEEPDAALVLIPGGAVVDGKRVTEILFVNEATQNSITWLGYRMGSSNVETLLDFDMGASNAAFADVLSAVAQAAGATRLYGNSPPQAATGTMSRMASAFAKWRSASGAALSNERSWSRYLARAREIKSPLEQKMVRRAVVISVEAHIAAMQTTKPGMREYEIAGLVKYVFARNGCEYPGYPPIVGSGPNSTILHYNTNRRMMQDGDIICMDTAGEFHGYTADITRSFPVNGKFSPEQKAIYEIVLRATDAGIAACKPGATRRRGGDVDLAIRQILIKGLQRLGIIQNANQLGRYYMHGWGHNIGLDVHDVQPRGTLEPGMTLTVEPGIYIKAGSPCDEKWWNIGIRIEDNVLITADGRVNMSASAPRTVAEIEATMRR